MALHLLLILATVLFSLEATGGDVREYEQDLSGVEILRMLGLGQQQARRPQPQEGRMSDVQQGAVQVTKYTRCELAEALQQAEVPKEQIASWVCIAVRLSSIDLSIVEREADGEYHGPFLVHEKWCARCGGSCERMRSTLALSIACARKVFDEAEREGGNGFSAWEASAFCKDAAAFVAHCAGSGTSVWVCLADSMTGLDIGLTKHDEEARYYGLFQVSDAWWCDVGSRRGCGVPCSVFRESLDSNIQCAKMVYAETRIQKGDGFVAWEGRHLQRCRNATRDELCPP